MIIEYLNTIKNAFQKDLEACESLLDDLEIQYKEVIRFIDILEDNNDTYMEAFSPRKTNEYQKRKLQDLYTEKNYVMDSIQRNKLMKINLEEKIKEVNSVIEEAYRLILSKNENINSSSKI